jgi:hypothetical protein
MAKSSQLAGLEILRLTLITGVQIIDNHVGADFTIGLR